MIGAEVMFLWNVDVGFIGASGARVVHTEEYLP
jgi:hypothetical protein